LSTNHFLAPFHHPVAVSATLPKPLFTLILANLRAAAADGLPDTARLTSLLAGSNFPFFAA
jgi:hypothetical protein